MTDDKEVQLPRLGIEGKVSAHISEEQALGMAGDWQGVPVPKPPGRRVRPGSWSTLPLTVMLWLWNPGVWIVRE